MSKNRRKESAAARFGPVVQVCLLCFAIGGAGVGYVWQKNQISELGKQITKCELKLAELRRQNKQKSDQLAQMQSPQALDQRVKKHLPGLLLPQPGQVIRLLEMPPPAGDPRLEVGRQIVRNDFARPQR